MLVYKSYTFVYLQDGTSVSGDFLNMLLYVQQVLLVTNVPEKIITELNKICIDICHVDPFPS